MDWPVFVILSESDSPDRNFWAELQAATDKLAAEKRAEKIGVELLKLSKKFDLTVDDHRDKEKEMRNTLDLMKKAWKKREDEWAKSVKLCLICPL
jgi:uncharacterized Ntn-hydrolase superfamily protein